MGARTQRPGKLFRKSGADVRYGSAPGPPRAADVREKQASRRCGRAIRPLHVPFQSVSPLDQREAVAVAADLNRQPSTTDQK